MSISLSDMVSRLSPQKTVLFFGAGSSIPSGAPSVKKIIDNVARKFDIDSEGYNLSEITSIAEHKASRSDLISTLRNMFCNLDATGALLNLPLYTWKNIYTTNYDKLIEQAYSKSNVPLTVYTSNFDFKVQDFPESTKLYKLHGTIEKDISDGIQSRIIISEADYDNASEYREAIYDALKYDMNGANLVIIGYSLADEHIKDIVKRAVEINNKSYNSASINLVLYTQDKNRVSLYERRGIQVAFGSLDDFFLEIQKHSTPKSLVYIASLYRLWYC